MVNTFGGGWIIGNYWGLLGVIGLGGMVFFYYIA
jgi:hypothetical protein